VSGAGILFEAGFTGSISLQAHLFNSNCPLDRDLN